MADDTTSTPAAPVATATPGSPIHINVQAPAAPAAKPAKTEAAPTAEAPKKTAAEKAQRQLLKKMGVPKDERDGMLNEIQAGRKKIGEVTKQAQDAKAQIEALKPYQERTAQLEASIKEYEALFKEQADAAFAALPEAAQKFIASQNVEEPKARMEMIKQLRAAGMISAQQAADATAAVKAPNPANTIANANPAAPKPGATLNHYEQWSALKGAGQSVQAARFYQLHGIKIEEQRPQK